MKINISEEHKLEEDSSDILFSHKLIFKLRFPCDSCYYFPHMFETLHAYLIIGKLIIEKTVRIMLEYSILKHIGYLSLLELSGINTEKN